MDNQVLDTPNSSGGNQPLPNSTAVLVLGIVSIVTMCCYGIVGLTCGIIALVLSRRDKILYDSNPGMYSLASLKNLNAGRICAIVGVCLSGIYIVVIIAYIAVMGTIISGMPWEEIFNR